MPTYEYIENGQKIVRVLPVSRRDEFPGRVSVPSRIAVCPRGAPSQEHAVMNGLRTVEQQMGTTAFRKAFPFSVEHTRKVWGKTRATDN